ncbi:Wzy polymerase domain-containing protein [Polaromonas sp.]|uniref:PglL family O-oligosaccharyltransferase n=1 Tax=Polaromonas sp. TaxID=1869339 RepID=UPI003CB2C5F2
MFLHTVQILKDAQFGRLSLYGSRSLAAGVLWAASCLLPLHSLPWVSFYGEALAFLAVLLLAWAAVLRPDGHDAVRGFSVPAFALPFMAAAILAIGQLAVGSIEFAGDAFVLVIYLFVCVVSLMLGFAALAGHGAEKDSRHQQRHESPLKLLASMVLLVSCASAVIAIAQVLEVWEHSIWINSMPFMRRPGANLGQPNHLATLLLMGMASLLALYEFKKLHLPATALIFLILSLALAVTESRTGLLSLLLLSVWWGAKRRVIGFRLSSAMAAIALVVTVGLFLSWPSIFDVVKISDVAAELNTQSGSRFAIWSQLLEAVSGAPWLGWGFNQVPKAHNAVAHSYVVSEAFLYSHNLLLDLALGMGVPLAVMAGLGAAIWLWRRLQATADFLPWYCIALVLPFAVHSMLEFPFAYAYFLVPVMFALGILESILSKRRGFQISLFHARVFLAAISAVAVWAAVEYVAIEEDFRVARFEALRIGKTPEDYRRPNIVLLTQLDALMNGARIVPRPGMSTEELDLARKVALRYPWSATQNRYALSLALNGNSAEAVRQLRIIRAMHGERPFKSISANWRELAEDKYPQLHGIDIPR